MDPPTKKKVASGKGEKDRVPAIFRELLEKCKTNNIEVSVLPAILNQKPKAGQMWNTYLIDKESISVNSTDTIEDIIKVYVAFPGFDKSGQPQKIYIKNTKTSSIFLNTLCIVLFKYERITTLTLMDCNLSNKAIEILYNHLLTMPNITEIILDGNPVNAQNHGLLASSESLQSLSLKRCKINEVGIETLYQNLLKNEQTKLQILNLTGNYINDTAAVGIEKILRENRSLSTLILADNWITDTGCYSIMSALQAFNLTHEETIKRRSIIIDYFRQKIKMTEEIKKEKIHVKITPTPPISVKSKKSAKSKKKDTGRKSVPHNEINKQVSDYVENMLPKITHPFICETESVNGEFKCTGNLVLGLLNLGYNRLTIKGYKYIIDMFDYQWRREQILPGLVYIVLNGNFDLQSYEYEEITRLVHEKLWRMETRNKSKVSAEIESYLSSAASTA